MQLIPVLEIRHGKSVHTERMKDSEAKVISLDPIETIDTWVEKGINRIHYVDVDAIETREPCNVDLLTKIKRRHPKLIVQTIGAIKSFDSASIWIEGGADYLVLTGKAIRQKNLLADISLEYPNKLLVELDSHNGNVGMGSGEPCFKLNKLAEQLEEDGVSGLIVTEVPSTGHVNNDSLLAINEFSQQIELPIYANGGVNSLNDLRNLLEHHAEKLSGVLLGKIVYQEDFCLLEARELLNQYHIAE